MDKIGEWIRYWLLFGWARGESVSRFDEKRIVNPFAPILGRIRVPRWVLLALVAIAVLIVLALLVGWFSRIEFVSQDTLVTQTGAVGCFTNIGGRLYVAVSCLLITYMPAVLYALLLVLMFFAGYATHAYKERRK